MSIDALKSLLLKTLNGDVVFEDMGEVHGTLIVERSVSLSIGGTTLIGQGAPAIIVRPGASLDLRQGQVSTSERDPRATANGVHSDWRPGTAIRVESGGRVSLANVDLLGDIAGDCPLAGEWHLPSAWVIHDLPARSRTRLAIRGYVPYRIEVSSDIHNVAVTHPTVGPGPVEFAIDVDARDFEAGTLLDGWIRFRGEGAIRRLRLRARLVAAVGRPTLATPRWESGAFTSPPGVHPVPQTTNVGVNSLGRSRPHPPAGLSPVFGPRGTSPRGEKVGEVGVPPVAPPREGDAGQITTAPLSLTSPQPAPGQTTISPIFGKRPASTSGKDIATPATSMTDGPEKEKSANTGAQEQQGPPPKANPSPRSPSASPNGVSSIFRRPGE